MIDKIKVVCALTALPVAIGKLVAYLYHSYMALSAMIVCGIAILVFFCLYHHNKNEQDGKLVTNHFFILVCVFSLLFLFSAIIMLVGNVAPNMGKRTYDIVMEDISKVSIWKEKAERQNDVGAQLKLGNWYLTQALENKDLSEAEKARSYFMEANSSGGIGEAYLMLGIMEEYGFNKQNDYAKALVYYIKGMRSDLFDNRCDSAIVKLKMECKVLIPDSIIEELTKRKNLKESAEMNWLQFFVKRPYNYNLILVSKTGQQSEVSYDVWSVLSKNTLHIDTENINLTKTLAENLSLLKELNKISRNYMEQTMLYAFYSRMLNPIYKAWEKEKKSKYQLL